MASDMIIRRENRISPLKIRLYRTYRTGRMCCVGRTCRMDRTCRLGEPNPIKRPNPNDWISRRPAARAFTLIELIVVVSILGLLLAITLPVLSSVLGSSTAKQTIVTMETLRTAIDYYAADRPLQNNNDPILDEGSNTYRGYSYIFGPYPPSPNATMAMSPGTPSVSNTSIEYESSMPPPYNEVGLKFLRLIETYIPRAIGKDPYPISNTDDYASIECFVLFLEEFSPQARAVLANLPDQVKSNQDVDRSGGALTTDGIVYDDGRRRDLYEIVDGWGKPLRYYAGATNGLIKYRWELRSAGPDGRFSDPGTPEDAGDDVVVTGP